MAESLESNANLLFRNLSNNVSLDWIIKDIATNTTHLNLLTNYTFIPFISDYYFAFALTADLIAQYEKDGVQIMTGHNN